ncbi:DNA-dependent RNA polymerase I subunit A43 [Moelleriella libera RCEF 2490]|uniref:DNA-directed RNA polymerase subunit n=1 Tax=Moelleriella libera RCEF 2490 TaxID=1081109 RepID=A0A166V712_9HYPO|nr:DNA-dependent RNA polymerase I subunit A43 [Moelleriella libera RCEF 2490]
MPAAASPDPVAPNSEKKHKKNKSATSEKKRAREEDAVGDGERKHKKSKSVTDPASRPNEITINQELVKEEKKKKKKKDKDVLAEAVPEGNAVPESNGEIKHKKKRKKDDALEDASEARPNGQAEFNSVKKEKRKKKRHSEAKSAVAEEGANGHAQDTLDEPDGDAMEVDESSGSHVKAIRPPYQPPDIPTDPQFPFFRQTVSLYEPIYPNGWAQPVTSALHQHLQHLHNKYVPSLRGVLLDCKNIALGPAPGRDGAAADDETPTTLTSKNDYAVGFGWITADVELFVPSRGAWMEGSVNLQTEGHIGVVCFGKFNASIEARRLPPAWKWVSNESTEANGFEDTASVITADDHGVVRQIHSTGFWVDGDGERVKGKIRFRIRNFDAGTSGEATYLSLEGTMLDKESEKKLVKEEAAAMQMRRNKKGGRGIERRRAPDFSMTRFEPEKADGQDDAAEPAQ